MFPVYCSLDNTDGFIPDSSWEEITDFMICTLLKYDKMDFTSRIK